MTTTGAGNFFTAVTPEATKADGAADPTTNGADFFGRGGRTEMVGHDFLDRVVAWPGSEEPGFINLHIASNRDGKKFWWGKPFQTKAEFYKLLWYLYGKGERDDFYFCTSLQNCSGNNKSGKPAAVRARANVLLLKAIWIDLDAKGGADSYASINNAVATLKEFIAKTGFPVPSLVVASSDKGRHCYWPFTAPVNLERWQILADALKNAAVACGLKCDTQCTVDAARLLRLPGTKNHKTEPPTDVKLMRNNPTDFEYEALLTILTPYIRSQPISTPAISGQGLTPGLTNTAGWAPLAACLRNINMESGGAGIEPERPELDIKQIFAKGGCPFLRKTVATKGKHNANPLWNLTTLAATFFGDRGNKLAHAMSSGHDKYTHDETEELFQRKQAECKRLGLGWPSCGAIQAAGCGTCVKCQHWGKIKSPLHLGLPIAPATGPAHDEANGLKAEAGVSLTDFSAYMPQHVFIFLPTREPWPTSSVDARIPPVPLWNPDGTPLLDQNGKQKKLDASVWLDRNRPVEQMTWAPGLPMLIRDRLIAEGGWIERAEVTCLNLYRPPKIKLGNVAEADPWLDHIWKVFGGDAGHIVKWLAHRVQRPQEKINHALVLGGSQGIGKDTMLEPVKHAVGPWNFIEVSPQQMLGRFNGFLKSVILRTNEARDLGEVNRFQFYDHTKSYIAAPPDVLRVDEKNLREHNVLNCCGVIITTNHKADGIFLPADDRRHFVAWSDLKKEDFADGYWNWLWDWYKNGGDRHVAAYLAELDISSFDPKAPPPKTPAFWDIVDANRAPEDAELADILDKLKNPDAVTLIDLTVPATGTFHAWIQDRKNRRAIPHRLEKCGYVPVRNDAAKDRLWVINGTRQAIYAKSELPIPDRFKAASDLARHSAASPTPPAVGPSAPAASVKPNPTPPKAAPSPPPA